MSEQGRPLGFTPELIDRVIGMLMHLWGLVKDEETRQAIQSTINELRVAEATQDWGDNVMEGLKLLQESPRGDGPLEP